MLANNRQYLHENFFLKLPKYMEQGINKLSVANQITDSTNTSYTPTFHRPGFRHNFLVKSIEKRSGPPH